MTLIAIIIQSFAFYCVYNTSQRAGLRKDKWSRWLQHRTIFSTTVAVLLFTGSFVLMIRSMGLATGIFTAFLSVMTLGSLIILFIPLTNKKH